MIVYLAGPIDHAVESDSQGLNLARSTVRGALLKHGASVYDPSRAWCTTNASRDGHAIQDLNVAALDKADMMIALCPIGVPTVGTLWEVYSALVERALPVAVWLGGAQHAVGASWVWMLDEYAGSVHRLMDLSDQSVKFALDWAHE